MSNLFTLTTRTIKKLTIKQPKKDFKSYAFNSLETIKTLHINYKTVTLMFILS